MCEFRVYDLGARANSVCMPDPRALRHMQGQLRTNGSQGFFELAVSCMTCENDVLRERVQLGGDMVIFKRKPRVELMMLHVRRLV